MFSTFNIRNGYFSIRMDRTVIIDRLLQGDVHDRPLRPTFRKRSVYHHWSAQWLNQYLAWTWKDEEGTQALVQGWRNTHLTLLHDQIGGQTSLGKLALGGLALGGLALAFVVAPVRAKPVKVEDRAGQGRQGRINETSCGRRAMHAGGLKQTYHIRSGKGMITCFVVSTAKFRYMLPDPTEILKG